jgi:nucleolar protein 56
VKVEVESYSEPENFVRDNIVGIGVELGIIKDRSHFYSLSREVTTHRARRNIQKAQSERGATIIQTVQLINELDKSLNILTGKLREWYSLHFPELNRIIDDHRLYVNLIEKLGNKNNFKFEKLADVGVQAKKNSILEARNTSMGADLQPEDEDYLVDLAKNLVSLYHYRDSLEQFIKNIAEEVIPNLSIVAGPVLAAKLVEKAGGLKKLAMMPSSTLQLLGAEKALFRSKKTKAKPPKHGLIFQHPYVNSKPRNLRGKAARTLAAKLSIAARADAFSGNPIGIDLRKQLYNEPKM